MKRHDEVDDKSCDGAHEEANRTGDPAPYPPLSRLAIETTYRCHRSCVYCYNAWKSDATYLREELSAGQRIALVNRVLDQIDVRRVEISGGEPLLDGGLIPLIESIRRRGMAVSLVTDGGLLDDHLATALAGLQVSPVQPTLLSARREVHNGLKGTDCFDETIAAIMRLKKHKIPIAVAFVCTKENYLEFQDVVELSFALGVRVIAFSRFCAAGEGARHLDRLTPTREMIGTCLDVAEQANDRLKMKVHVSISLPHCIIDPKRYPHLTFGSCALLSKSPGFTIDPAGNLRACSVSSTILGNLAEESWSQIIDRSRNGYFRMVSEIPALCRECHLLPRCKGGCRESARTCFGDFSRPDPMATV